MKSSKKVAKVWIWFVSYILPIIILAAVILVIVLVWGIECFKEALFWVSTVGGVSIISYYGKFCRLFRKWLESKFYIDLYMLTDKNKIIEDVKAKINIAWIDDDWKGDRANDLKVIKRTLEKEFSGAKVKTYTKFPNSDNELDEYNIIIIDWLGVFQKTNMNAIPTSKAHDLYKRNPFRVFVIHSGAVRIKKDDMPFPTVEYIPKDDDIINTIWDKCKMFYNPEELWKTVVYPILSTKLPKILDENELRKSSTIIEKVKVAFISDWLKMYNNGSKPTNNDLELYKLSKMEIYRDLALDKLINVILL